MLETIKAVIETKSLIAPLTCFVEDFVASNDVARSSSDLDVLPKAMEDCIMSSTLNFYDFGCDFFRPTIDLENSIVMSKEKQHRCRSAKLRVLAREILLISIIAY
eukprot:10493643-Ditylum_brightwellii.AAC.1